MSEFSKKTISWEEYNNLVHILLEKIKLDNFRPKEVVAIMRGGAVLGVHLSNILESNFSSVEVESYGKNHARICNMKVGPLEGFTGIGKKRNILIVDDLVDEGLTVRAVIRKYFNGKTEGTVKVATLFKKPWTTFEPHYWAKEASEWLVFPWETDTEQFYNIELAWLAGIIDGEGTIAKYISKQNSPIITIKISNTCSIMVEKIDTILTKYNINHSVKKYPPCGKGTKDVYVVSACGLPNTQKLATYLIPYLTTKKQKALDILKLKLQITQR